MKVLLDACVWKHAGRQLRELGHEVELVAEWAADPGDREILAHAYEHGQVLVTCDKDFGELAIHRGQPHGGLVRLAYDLPARDHGAVTARILWAYAADLTAGALIVAEADRVRVRRAD